MAAEVPEALPEAKQLFQWRIHHYLSPEDGLRGTEPNKKSSLCLGRTPTKDSSIGGDFCSHPFQSPALQELTLHEEKTSGFTFRSC